MSVKSKGANWRKLGTSPYLWLFVIISMLYGLLYIRFLVGDFAYVYTDIGGDTFDINYPLYNLFSDVFHGKGYEDYMLNVGLGMDMSSYLYQYFNPINLLMVLIPKRLIPWGIMLALYMKLHLLGIFSYKLFHKLTKETWGSFAGALIWTFSGYVMLWGQHYGFCTSLVMFTVFLYLVYLYTEEQEKSRNGILVLWVAWMLFTSYYFLYMTAFASGVFVVLYMIFNRKSPKQLFKKLAGLAGMGILGMGIGGACLIPTLNTFTESTRSTAVGAVPLAALFFPNGADTLYSFLARFFSNNTMGIANDYTGAGNYYEIAMLFTSSFFLIALPYLLTKKETCVKTLVLTILSVLALVFPVSGKLFTLTLGSHRWTFLLCFLEAYACAVALGMLWDEEKQWRIVVSLIAAAALTGGSYFLLIQAEKQEYFELDYRVMILYGVFLVIYGCLLLAKGWVRPLRIVLPGIMILVLCVEVLVNEYPTVNERLNPTRSQLAVEGYNDGTREAVASIPERDTTPYRVVKTYESASENDGIAQGYAGLRAYMITNPTSWITYRNMYGGHGISDNFVEFNSDNYFLSSLLGVKYLVSREEERDSVSTRNYAYVKEMGAKQIYRNQNALPFGYLYDSVWEKETVESYGEIDRTLAAVNGFYFTDDADGEKAADYAQAQMGQEQEQSLMDWDFTANDCQTKQTKTGIVITDFAEDPNIVMEGVGEVLDEGPVHRITMNVAVDRETDMALYYKRADQEKFRGDQILIFTVSPENPEWTYTLPGDVEDIRIDVSSEVTETTITGLTLSNCPDENAAYKKLQNSEVNDIKYDGNTYSAAVANTAGNTKMLCVPFMYARGWKASLDGKSVTLYNINSGLCGVEIPAGEHQVTLTYEVPHKNLGVIISGVSFVIYLIWLAVAAGLRKNKNQKQPVQKY